MTDVRLTSLVQRRVAQSPRVWCLGLFALAACSGTPEPTSPEAVADVASVDAADDAGDAGATDDSAAAAPSNDSVVSVQPDHGPSNGGTQVTIKGKGFTDVESVWFGESKALSVEFVDDETLRVVAPPRPPGIVDVMVLRVDPETQTSDELRLSAAYRFFAAVRIDAVSPNKGPNRGGALATISGAGFRPGTHFVFGTRLAVDPVILDEFTATVVTPQGPLDANAAQGADQQVAVDVTASNADGAATLAKGYTFARVPEQVATGVTVLPVKPDVLDTAGGTAIEVRWSGTAPGSLVGVRVGGLMASQLSHAGGSSAKAVAPKGSPGPADVSLIFAGGVATRTDAVVYTSTQPFVAALLPARGAQAGGTMVQVVGSALNRLTTLRFGEKEAEKGQVKHPGLVWVRAPGGEPGTTDVTANFSGAGAQTLFNAWTWFDPQQAGWGTWGGPIQGALNVTVRREDWPGGVVQGALVVIGEDTTPKLKGYTDERGQVTLSEPGLVGPLNVHASAPGYGAGSLVVFDARNVTILIRKHPTGEPGGGPTGVPGNVFDLGEVQGRVRYADKVVQLPLGHCGQADIAQAGQGGQCAPCATGDTCDAGLGCSGLIDAIGGLSLANPATGSADPGTHCLRPCLQGGDCDEGWECRAVGTPGQATWTTRCVPRIGKPETRCETSAFDRFTPAPDPGNLATAKGDGTFTLKTRLGEMAVMCRSGYIRASDGAFVPLIMGITRGVIVPDDKTPVKTEVWLDTPLTRQVHFALEPLPMGPETSDHRRFLRAWLDLGGEGFLELGRAQTFARTNRLDVARMPSQLQGELATLPWTVYAGLVNDDDDDGGPSSLAMDRDIKIAAGDFVAQWPSGAPAPSQGTAYASPVRALGAGAAGLFAVGERGRVLRWTGLDFTTQQSPTDRDLHALWMDPATPDGWAAGDDGVLLRRDALVGWQVAPSPTNADVLALSGGAQGPWLLDVAGGLFHHTLTGWEAVQGPPGAVGLRALAVQTVQAPPPASAVVLDALWLAGAQGALWHGLPGVDGKFTWTKLQGGSATTTWLAVHADGDAVWLAGTAGQLAVAKNGALSPLVSGVQQPLRALAPRKGGGVHVVGGAGSWLEVAADWSVTPRHVTGLEVDLHGIAQVQGTWIASGLPTIRVRPYLPMPKILAPQPDKPVGKVVKWQVNAGPPAEMHRVQITTFWRQSYWTVHGPGDLTEVPLADFVQLGGWNPLPDGPLRVRVWRLYGPKLSVDRFNHNEMTPWAWGAWSFAWHLSKK